jgi:hypothetical protein
MGLTTVPPSCAHCLESWKFQPPGTLKACPAQGFLCCLFLIHSTSLGTANGSVALDTTRGRRHNEFFLLQSHGSFIFKILWRRAQKLQNYTEHTENVCMFSVSIPFRVCGQCIMQISVLICDSINIKLAYFGY